MKDPYSVSGTVIYAPVLPIYSNANAIVSAKSKKSKSKKSKSKKSKSKNSKNAKTQSTKPIPRTKPVPRQRIRPVVSPLMQLEVPEVVPDVVPDVVPEEPPKVVKRTQPKPKPRARVKPVDQPVNKPSVQPVQRRMPFNLLEPFQRMITRPKAKRGSVFFKENNVTGSNASMKKQLLLRGTRVNRMPQSNHPLLRMSLKRRKEMAKQLNPIHE